MTRGWIHFPFLLSPRVQRQRDHRLFLKHLPISTRRRHRFLSSRLHHRLPLHLHSTRPLVFWTRFKSKTEGRDVGPCEHVKRPQFLLRFWTNKYVDLLPHPYVSALYAPYLRHRHQCRHLFRVYLRLQCRLAVCGQKPLYIRRLTHKYKSR